REAPEGHRRRHRPPVLVGAVARCQALGDDGEQRAGPEWLRQVPDGAGRRRIVVVLRRPPAHRDDGHAAGEEPDLLHDLLAWLVRHDRIAEDQIEGLLLKLAYAVGAVAGGLDLVSAGLEDGADNGANVVFVVDDENASHATASHAVTGATAEAI